MAWPRHARCLNTQNTRAIYDDDLSISNRAFGRGRDAPQRLNRRESCRREPAIYSAESARAA